MAQAKHKSMVLFVMCLCVVLIIATVAAINISVPQIEGSSLLAKLKFTALDKQGHSSTLEIPL